MHVCTEAPIEPRIKGLVGHRIKTIGEVQHTRGVRVTTPRRTHLDLDLFTQPAPTLRRIRDPLLSRGWRP